MLNNPFNDNYNIDFISQNDENYFNYDHSIKGIDELSIPNDYNNFDNTSFTSLDKPVPANSECKPNIIKEYISKLNTIDIKENKKEELILTQKKTKPKKSIEEICTPKKLGRKKKFSNETGRHNKYSDDNLIRKTKNKILKKILNYINNIINDKNKELLNLSPKELAIANINYNKELFNRTLKDIFSSEISRKYLKYEVFHNKNVIEKLLNDEDIEKRDFYETLFNLTFLDCIKHIRGETSFPVLNKLGSLNDIVKDLDEDIEYKEFFKNFIQNYEEKINSKKGRVKKKKEKKDITYLI